MNPIALGSRWLAYAENKVSGACVGIFVMEQVLKSFPKVINNQ